MGKTVLSDDVAFGELLYTILLREKQYKPTAIASALGMTLRGLNLKMRGIGRFSPEEIARLLNVVPDKRLASWFLEGSGLLLVNRPVVAAPEVVLPLEQAVACVTDVIPAICDLTEALHRAMLGDWQRAAIEAHLDRAQAGLLSIKLLLSSAARVTNGADAPDAFRHLVRRALIEERGIRLDALAGGLGLTYSALYLRMSGRTAFRPIELRRLFRTYPDARCAAYLLAGSPYMAIPRPAAGESAPDAGPLAAGLEALRAIAKLVRLLKTGQEMPRADLWGLAEDCLEEAVRLVATTRWTMTFIGRSPAGPDRSALSRRAS